MLYFREHRWLRVNSRSRFNAMIKPKDRTCEDVYWWLDLEFVAGGAVWRRVHDWERPSFPIGLSSMKPPRCWTDIEDYNFWGDPVRDKFGDDYAWHYKGAGLVDACYESKTAGVGPNYTFGGNCVWRVAAREGRWFTIEMAGLADGSNILGDMAKRPVAVTPDGCEEQEAQPDADEEFWRKNSEFYLVEQVPFGMVTVHVPRNVRDPEAYAVARSRALAGTGEPEHIDWYDAALSENSSENIRGDLLLYLHFNAYYED
jgi:hypothetical protein